MLPAAPLRSPRGVYNTARGGRKGKRRHPVFSRPQGVAGAGTPTWIVPR
jgi:hypothetical protein